MSAMPKPRISSRMAFAFIGVAILAIVAITVAINIPAIQIRYYEWQMQRARHEVYDGPRTVQGGFVVAEVSSEAEERYEYYREKLVEWGGIIERRYVFRHVCVPTDESRRLTKLLVSGSCPKHIDFSSPFPDKPEPMQLTVWCRPADASAWDAFVAKHDVPGDD